MAMADAAKAPGVMLAADGTPLKLRLRQAERRERIRALTLIAPLFLFIAVTFLLPIGFMLRNAVYDPDLGENLPATAAALEDWRGTDLPGEAVFEAFAADMKAAHGNKTTAFIGKRLNHETSGMRAKVVTTGRKPTC